MLIIDVSKTRSTSQRLELDGDGIDYIIQIDWSTRYQRFFVKIFDSEKNLLISGLKLVPGSPINLGNKDSDGPQGLFIVIGSGDLTRDSFDNGGYKLYYFPRSGAITFPFVSEYLTITDFQEYVEEEAADPPNLYDGFFITDAQAGDTISPVITTFSTDEVSWLWGDGDTTYQDSTPNKSYTDNSESHEVDTYTVHSDDFQTIDVSNCHITDISVTPLINLESITANGNSINDLTTLGLSSLSYLNIQDNLIDEFQLSGNSALEEFQGANNSFTEMVVEDVPSLKIMNVAGNEITSLDPYEATALEELYVSNNPIGTLDPTNNLSLTTLEAFGCELSGLDISQNPLERFIASYNSISAIASSNLSACTYFDIRQNDLDVTSVDGVLENLDANNLLNGTVDLTDNTAPSPSSSSYITSLEGKGWNVFYDEIEVTFNFIITTSNVSGAETGSNQFKLPLVFGESYNFRVYWGDSSSDQITSYGQAEATHTYSSPGTYQIGISMSGTLGAFAFNGAGDAVKVDSIQDWSEILISAGMFDGCINAVYNATDAPTIGTTMERVFRNNASAVTIPGIADWDVSNVINFDYTFEGATLFNQNLVEE